MILLYVLFLPPAERAKILEDTTVTTAAQYNQLNPVLLKESPGRLDLLQRDTIAHKLTSFSLLSTTEGKILKDFNSVYVEKSDFSEKPLTLQFDLDNVENIDNVILSFGVIDASGALIITLNGNIITQTSYKKGEAVAPINIPKNLLTKSNSIKFQASSPGVLFFKTNKYSLLNVKLFGDVTDKSGFINTQSFFITTQEDNFLEKATVSFLPNCKETDVSRLQVSLNNQEVYSGIPNCKLPVKIEVGSGRVLEGENKIMFAIDKGAYNIDQLLFTSNLKDLVYPTYYFELTDDQYQDLKNNFIDVNMTVTFVRSVDFQDVEVEINGRKFSIDNKKRVFNQVIDPYLIEDNNAITLRPLDGAVEIVGFKVQVFDRTNSTTN